MFDEIEFEVMARPDPGELADFYRRQGNESPKSSDQLLHVLDATCCCVTARRNDLLIGWARGVTNGVRGRLAECKLDPLFQGPACVTRRDGRIEHDESGIAREMARLVIEALRAKGVEGIDVLAYGTEVDFCEELGFRKLRGVVPMELPVGKSVSATMAVSVSVPG